MKKNKYIALLFALIALIPMACEDDIEPVVENLALGRILAPVGLTIRVRNEVTAELDWTPSEGADNYVVQISNDNFNTDILEFEVLAENLPVQQILNGETPYTARVKALSEGKGESKWAQLAFETDAEQIFPSQFPGENFQDTYAILQWPAGSEVSHFFISPGNLLRQISAAEAAAGEATITGLAGATDYVITIYNESNRRGNVAFSTLKESNVSPLDDLAAVIAAAADGAVLILSEGEYEVGSIPLDKSIVIEGQKSYDKPVIFGQFSCGATVGSIELVNLDMRGNGTAAQGQFFNAATGCDLSSLTVKGCEISYYTNNFIYNNAGGSFGDVLVTDCYVHDIEGGGGDGIDFRGGTINSLTVENSTIANGIRTFLRMQAECNSVFANNTFYRVANVDSGNNRGLFRSSGGGTLEVKNCLFVETGLEGTERGNWSRAGDMTATASYSNNFYYNCFNIWVGEYTDPSQVDATESDPGFVDPAQGDFTVTNQTIIDENAGDPRWHQ